MVHTKYSDLGGNRDGKTGAQKVQVICPRGTQKINGWTRIQIQISLAHFHYSILLLQSDTLENGLYIKLICDFIPAFWSDSEHKNDGTVTSQKMTSQQYITAYLEKYLQYTMTA